MGTSGGDSGVSRNGERKYPTLRLPRFARNDNTNWSGFRSGREYKWGMDTVHLLRSLRKYTCLVSTIVYELSPVWKAELAFLVNRFQGYELGECWFDIHFARKAKVFRLRLKIPAFAGTTLGMPAFAGMGKEKAGFDELNRLSL